MEAIKQSASQMTDIISYVFNTMDPIDYAKPLTEEDVTTFKSHLVLKMDNYQHPFSTLVNMFPLYIKDKSGKVIDEDIDWKAMYRYLKKNYKYMRITQVLPADDTEGLAKKFIDYIHIEDTQDDYINKEGKKSTWAALSDKEKKKKENLEKHKMFVNIDSYEDLSKLNDRIFTLSDYKKSFKGLLIDKEDLKNFISPTLKQIEITSWKQLKEIWDNLNKEDNESYPIGFTYLNEIMDATELAYNSYTYTGIGKVVIPKLLSIQKSLMRLSWGFVIRNIMDTFNQLLADQWKEQGLYGAIPGIPKTLKYLQYGFEVYSMYEALSEERMFTLLDIRAIYTNLSKVKTKEEYIAGINKLHRYLNSYVKQAEDLKEPSQRIQTRLMRARILNTQCTKYIKQLENGISTFNNKVPNLITQIYNFLYDTRFAEYIKFYDTKTINGESILGLRIDANTKQRKESKRIIRKLNKRDSLFEQLLIDISAFMETNAMPDMFREHQYKTLYQATEQVLYEQLIDTNDKTINELEKQVDKVKKDSSNVLMNMIKGPHDWFTEKTENLARILGFIYNKEMYGKSFNANVQKSLVTWFNYGQRTPIEMQLMFDIPYISFPIRSITNWVSRILDPSYARLMDDIIDGMYGQYADEDGQYSEYVEFMIQNGWVPITDKFGVRMGAGAFDIMNLLKNPAEQIEQRRSPVLQGLKELLYKSHDVSQAASKLATVGVLNRAAQAVTLGSYNKKSKTFTGPTIGRASSMLFEYNQYTPKKYNYLYSNNGRAKYYENIYRDWFTKYGRMRKPTVDPVSLVKNIQWKQFLRRMQNKYRR